MALIISAGVVRVTERVTPEIRAVPTEHLRLCFFNVLPPVHQRTQLTTVTKLHQRKFLARVRHASSVLTPLGLKDCTPFVGAKHLESESDVCTCTLYYCYEDGRLLFLLQK